MATQISPLELILIVGGVSVVTSFIVGFFIFPRKESKLELPKEEFKKESKDLPKLLKFDLWNAVSSKFKDQNMNVSENFEKLSDLHLLIESNEIIFKTTTHQLIESPVSLKEQLHRFRNQIEQIIVEDDGKNYDLMKLVYDVFFEWYTDVTTELDKLL